VCKQWGEQSERRISVRTNARLFFIILLAGLVSFVNIVYAEPAKFNYGAIPFGQSREAVLKLLEGAEVNNWASIEELGHYTGFLKFFNEGLYTDPLGLGVRFLEGVIESYSISYKGWDNLDTIDLYFTKGYKAKDSDYTLFMVVKEQKHANGSYEDVFKDVEKTITNALKTTGKRFHGKYQVLNQAAEPASVEVWELQTTSIFLLVHNDIFFSSKPIIIYRNNKGWQKYLSACNKADRENRKATEKKNKPDF
jgi:hypothetical protein